MSLFVYRAYEQSGKRVRGEIEASSRESALAALESRGLVAYFVDPRSKRPALSLDTELFVRRDFSRKDAALFLGELSALLAAELRVEESLSLIAKQMREGPHREILQFLIDQTRRGEPLSQSMRMRPKSFTAFECAIIQNGERSGDLAGAARLAADILDSDLAYRNKLSSALIYPAILTMTALGAILIVSLYLAPAISPMFTRTGTQPPAAFSALLVLSSIIRNWWWAILGAISLAYLGARQLLRHPVNRLAFEKAALRVPLIGAVIRNAETARLCRALSMLLRSGAPIADAIEEAGGVCRTHLFRHWAVKARAAVRQGAHFSAELARLDEASAIGAQFAEIGERTGRLEQMLDRAADHADAAATRASTAMMNALPPLLTVLMGLVVGSLIAIVLTTILSANELVFDQ